MSNYKPRIESNNLDLTSILSTINELPDAGASVETATITFDYNDVTNLVYYDADGNYHNTQTPGTIEVSIPSMVMVVTDTSYGYSVSGNIISNIFRSGFAACYVYGNCVIHGGGIS